MNTDLFTTLRLIIILVIWVFAYVNVLWLFARRFSSGYIPSPFLLDKKFFSNVGAYNLVYFVINIFILIVEVYAIGISLQDSLMLRLVAFFVDLSAAGFFAWFVGVVAEKVTISSRLGSWYFSNLIAGLLFWCVLYIGKLYILHWYNLLPLEKVLVGSMYSVLGALFSPILTSMAEWIRHPLTQLYEYIGEKLKR